MPRSTRAVARNKRKKKVLRTAKGYFGGRKNLYRTAKDAVEKGWSTPTATGRRRSATSAGSGSPGSTPPPGRTIFPTPAS